jgi:hypothetical protein
MYGYLYISAKDFLVFHCEMSKFPLLAECLTLTNGSSKLSEAWRNSTRRKRVRPHVTRYSAVHESDRT